MRRSRGLSDPTIPRKSPGMGNARERNKVSGPTWGRLVDYGGTVGVVLTDSRGNSWSADSVRMLSGSFGSYDEGQHRAPRAWKYAGDVPLVEGDTFLIEFLDNNPDKPVIIGGVRPLKVADAEFFPPQPLGEDPNPARMRMVLRDAAGVITGHVQVSALDGGRNVEIVVGGALYGQGLRLLLDHTTGQIKIGGGLETHPLAHGDAVLDALATLAADLVTVASAAAVTLVDTPALIGEIETSQAASGPPMLSSIIRTE